MSSQTRRSTSSSTSSAPAPVRPPPSATDSNADAIDELDGNAADLTTKKGVAVEHREVALTDAENAPDGPPAAEAGEAARKVKVVRGYKNKLRLPAADAPSADDLYVDSPKAGQEVDGFYGTVDAPYAAAQVDPGAIYVGGGPRAEDVNQGGIGDCWLQSILLSMVSSDASHVEGMIENNGNTVSVTLHRLDTRAGQWIPVKITTDKQLPFKLDEAGDKKKLHGAGFYVSEQPAYGDWYADVSDRTLETYRDDYYEMALWAPLLEKAYARFAEQYGQYGGYEEADRQPGASVDENGDAVSGYKIIDGGYEDMAYAVFYGGAVEDAGTTDWSYEAGAGLSDDQVAVVEKLLMLQGVGLQDGEKALIQVSTWFYEVSKRLSDHAAAVVSQQNRSAAIGVGKAATGIVGGLFAAKDLYDAWSDGSVALRGRLDDLVALVDEWQTSYDDAVEKQIGDLCGELVDPEAYPVLHAEDAPEVYDRFLEVALIAAHSGTDKSGGQRFVYDDHSYAVLGASIRGHDGAALDLASGEVGAKRGDIATGASTVTLRNPHHANSPDKKGEGNPDDTGEFTLTLDQFLRSFSTIASGVVRCE